MTALLYLWLGGVVCDWLKMSAAPPDDWETTIGFLIYGLVWPITLPLCFFVSGDGE